MTSLDGAAIRDIIKVLRRRYANAHLVIRPARVQGDGAALEIARGRPAPSRACPGVDVVIVGRGGGSIEDLWAFNEEVVARAIAASPVPVISAVGHETDVTIADFVADVRAPTPSAAAEMVVAREGRIRRRIDRLRDRLRGGRAERVQTAEPPRARRRAARPAFAGFPARLAMRGRHVAELHARADATRSRAARRRSATRRAAGARAAARSTFDAWPTAGRARTRLVSADGAPAGAAIAPTTERATRSSQTAAGRLERSARSPSSAAATRSAGTRTARASCATPPAVAPGDTRAR